MDVLEQTYFLNAAISRFLDKLIEMFMRIADKDGDRKLKIDEVVNMFVESEVHTTDEEEEDQKERMKALFRMYDCNGDGVINKKELMEMLELI